jgi:carboxypeptidase PM20D1
MFKKVILPILIVLVLFIAFIMIQTVTLKSKQISVDAIEKIEVREGAAERLAEAIRIPTISFEDRSLIDTTQFDKLQEFIFNNYPLVDSLLDLTLINHYSMLYHWPGSNPDLKPAMLVGHLDVVPPEEESLDKWEYPPFDGVIKNGTIYGRGSLDDKLSVLGILESVEMMLADGYQPERGWYFGFGHDEEIFGTYGAIAIAKYMKDKGVKAEFILDEGLVVAEGMVPGIEKPVGLIGITEKGYMTVELHVEIQGGHSSMPEKENAITVLSKAITSLTENPFEPELSKPVLTFAEYVGPEAPFLLKMAFANLWLFKGMVISKYQQSGPGSALVMSTIAPTILKSGVKENVIPSHATAIVNLRILPGLTIDGVVDYFNTTINDDRVIVRAKGQPREASPVASVDHLGFKSIEKTILQVFDDVIVAPSLVLATTDSRYYTEVSDNIYKFLPVVLTSEDVAGIHGYNEHLSVEGYHDCIRFYYQLIRNVE